VNNENKRRGEQCSVHFSIFIERKVRYAITTPTKLMIAPMRPNTIAIVVSGETAWDLAEKRYDDRGKAEDKVARGAYLAPSALGRELGVLTHDWINLKELIFKAYSYNGGELGL
jgi:hypothetical protein